MGWAGGRKEPKKPQPRRWPGPGPGLRVWLSWKDVGDAGLTYGETGEGHHTHLGPGKSRAGLWAAQVLPGQQETSRAGIIQFDIGETQVDWVPLAEMN